MTRIFYYAWEKPACCVSKISSDCGCQSKETGVGMEVRLLSVGARGFFSSLRDSPSRLRRSILSLPTRKNTSGTQGRVDKKKSGNHFGVDKKKSGEHCGVGIISGAVQITASSYHVTPGVLGDFACRSYFSSPTRGLILFHSPFICFVDQTSANEMVTAVLKSCIAGILVFSFCTAGIVKITNKIAPQAYEQMVSCLVLTDKL